MSSLTNRITLGPDVMHMSEEWLLTRLANHEHWTQRQLDQGRVVRRAQRDNVTAFRKRA